MLFCVLFVFCSRSDEFWAVSNWSPDCLGQLLFWLRLSFLVIWWLLLKFVLPGSVYLFLYFSYLTVTSFLLPSGMLLLIHYKFLPPSFVFLLHFHIFFSSFISSVFFWYRNCSVFSNFDVGLACICIVVLLGILLKLALLWFLTFEVKPYLTVPTLYSCFNIFMTYWAYVLCYFVFCLSFVPDLTNFELLVIDLRIYLFLYLCVWFLVFLLFFIHFDCNYHIFFHPACWFPSPSFGMLLFHLYFLHLCHCSLYWFYWQFWFYL